MQEEMGHIQIEQGQNEPRLGGRRWKGRLSLRGQTWRAQAVSHVSDMGHFLPHARASKVVEL